MNCPRCPEDKTGVKLTIAMRDLSGRPLVHRRHYCQTCGCRWETTEEVTKVTFDPTKPADVQKPEPEGVPT
jgi:transcriptional regulator NrdR family protein